MPFGDMVRRSPLVKYFVLGVVAVAVIFMMAAAGSLVENVGADQVIVIQAPFSGNLTWYDTPGMKWQGFGKVMVYHKRSQFWFSAAKDQGKTTDQSIKVRFNDNGHGFISGSTAWEMPGDLQHRNLIHTKYGTQEAVEQQLIRTIVEKSVYMTGPLMSSKESASERRNELIYYIEDQIALGIYDTETITRKEEDQMTGQMKTVAVVKIIQGEDGKPVRQDKSPLEEFGIRTFNLALNSIDYDDAVEGQIKAQQEMTMGVQTAIAEARKAEQAAITAMKNGEADAAKAKWAQEVIKATAVTKAQQELEVAKLETAAAEQFKQKETLIGEGEAARKRLVMNADGALEKKLATYEAVMGKFADAMANYKGQWVPTVLNGGGSSGQGYNGAQTMMDMFSFKVAKDLGLDLSIPQGATVK